MNALRSLVLMLLALSTAVHALPVQISTVEVAGDSVHAVMLIPVAALSGADDDGDGHLSPAELRAHRTYLDRLLTARFRLLDGDEPERVEQQDLQILALEKAGSRDADYLILTRRSRWARPVDNLEVDVDLFSMSGAASHMLVRATKGSRNEEAVMHAHHMRHVFFRGPLARAQAAIAAGARYFLREYDSFLIAFAMFMVAFGWRHLLRW